MPSRRIRVGVLFGGRSCEHEVSLASARSVLRAIDREKLEPVPIAVTKAGEWIAMDAAELDSRPETAASFEASASWLPALGHRALIPPSGANVGAGLAGAKLDVIFPLIHGPLGEDGTVQGLLELAQIPYVGAGVLGSAVGMDKGMMKAVLEHHGLDVSPYRVVLRKAWEADPISIRDACEIAFPYPWFVKPANLGSSIGVSKVHGRAELGDAMALAARYDRKLIIEAAIAEPREIEVAVLGNDAPIASVPGEIIPCNEFYDYSAKYLDERTELRIPAELPPPVVERVRRDAIRAYEALDCAGLGRVDFLVRSSDCKVFVSEINTLPGFTSVSMYPKLWEASGIPYARLIERLVDLALERHAEGKRCQVYFPVSPDNPT